MLMDLLREIDEVRDRAVADVSYDFAAGRYQGVVEARAVVKKAAARVRELEDENQRMRDTIASRIVEEERSVQEQITKEPLNSWLAGVLFGLQRSRDIVTSPAREIAEEEA